MNFRRNEFDVTNRINTTDPVCVKLEVVRIYRGLLEEDSSRPRHIVSVRGVGYRFVP